MGEQSKIQWCDHTWSPWRGCTKVSEGCRNCYAESLSRRNPSVLGEWGPQRKRVINADWKKPLAWDRKAARDDRRVKVFPSLCDPFEDREDLHDVRERFGATIQATPRLDWLLLTKRPEHAARSCVQLFGWDVIRGLPPNVWLGVSVEDQAAADERIPKLLEIPAVVRWLSVEPLLGPVDLTECFEQINGIHWVVIGGESGPHARPCHLEWIRDLVRQCAAASVPCFVKQLGSYPALQYPGTISRDRVIKDSKGGNPDEWPEDLRVREWPR